MRKTLIFIGALLVSSAAMADGQKSLSSEATDDGVPRRKSSGLSVFASAGAVWADGVNANFYSGRPGNANTIDRVLHSNSYGTRIWTALKTSGLISDAIGSYNELQVVEYPEMYYRTSYLIAGLMLGLSIAVWYQSAFLVLAILVMLCVKRDFKGALMTFIGIVIALLLVWVLLMILNVNPWHYIRP